MRIAFLQSLLLMVVLPLHTPAQSALKVETRPCTKVLAILPTKPGLLSASVEWDSRERFELRECGSLQVRAYGENGKSPLLVYDTGEEYPRALYHLKSILAFQALGGAADHVYVFVIEKGKASLALKTATKDHIKVTTNGDQAIIEVPPPTYPDESGRFPPQPPPKRHVFQLH